MVTPPQVPPGMVRVPSGRFLMGSDLPEYPEEGPPREVRVDGFWIDKTPVTVGQFGEFVGSTGHVTVAERPLDPSVYPNVPRSRLVAGSLVFTPTARPVDLTNMANWWRYVAGADWAHPEGPGSTTRGREQHPVTHVAWADVAAYAAWTGKEVPTETEWEWAAHGGTTGTLYPWGDELMPGGRPMANHWLGEFPWHSRKPASRLRTSAVGSYPANAYGLVDMIGNTWEWTSDFYLSERHGRPGCCTPLNPRVDNPDRSYDAHEPGGAHIPRRVIKGGSHLCAENYCRRYRPAARQPQQLESSMSHIGFRCIRRDVA